MSLVISLRIRGRNLSPSSSNITEERVSEDPSCQIGDSACTGCKCHAERVAAARVQVAERASSSGSISAAKVKGIVLSLQVQVN